MFEINDFIVYGKRGVFKVTDIKTMNNDENGKSELYYILAPAFENYTIYAPVDLHESARPIISTQEAENLIQKIPELRPKPFYTDRITELRRHYEKYFENNDCFELIELIMSISAKKKIAEKQKKKFGQIDKQFLEKAEDLLYGEFSLALGIAKDKMKKYITSKIKSMNKNTDKKEKVS